VAEGVFTVLEINDGSDPANADIAELFEWTADSTAKTPFDGQRGGGAKACPIKPWGIGGAQRTVRTNYPNAKIPSAQVLGPIHKPHSFSGKWDDRYNGPGYAKFEWRRFTSMCERGSIVKVQYDDLAYEGIITEWTCNVQRVWDIDYQFTIDVYNRPDETDRSRVPTTPNDAITSLDAHDTAVQATLDADQRAPRNAMTGTLADDVSTSLVGMVDARESLAASIDRGIGRVINAPDRLLGVVDRGLATGENVFTRIATQFRAARGQAFKLIVRLSRVRADLDMAQLTAIGVLDFEDWSRSLRYTARIAMGTALAGDLGMTEHAEPNAVRLYRPSAGEHLYGISRRFYGTAHAWRLIYDRNALKTFVMAGSETLIIPERGAS